MAVIIMGTGSVGVAGATTPPAPALHIKSGGEWTAENVEGGCEVQTFGAGTFTADIGGDSGSYSSVGTKISETWNAGQDEGLTFKGHYSKSLKEYKGKFGGFDAGDTGFIVKGVVSSYNGFDC